MELVDFAVLMEPPTDDQDRPDQQRHNDQEYPESNGVE